MQCTVKYASCDSSVNGSFFLRLQTHHADYSMLTFTFCALCWFSIPNVNLDAQARMAQLFSQTQCCRSCNVHSNHVLCAMLIFYSHVNLDGSVNVFFLLKLTNTPCCLFNVHSIHVLCAMLILNTQCQLRWPS